MPPFFFLYSTQLRRNSLRSLPCSLWTPFHGRVVSWARLFSICSPVAVQQSTCKRRNAQSQTIEKKVAFVDNTLLASSSSQPIGRRGFIRVGKAPSTRRRRRCFRRRKTRRPPPPRFRTRRGPGIRCAKWRRLDRSWESWVREPRRNRRR